MRALAAAAAAVVAAVLLAVRDDPEARSRRAFAAQFGPDRCALGARAVVAQAARLADGGGAATGTDAWRLGLEAMRRAALRRAASTPRLCEDLCGAAACAGAAAGATVTARDDEAAAWALAARLADAADAGGAPTRAVVVGGGPVGLLHAAAAARAGADVTVFEKRAPGLGLYARRVWFDLEAPARDFLASLGFFPGGTRRLQRHVTPVQDRVIWAWCPLRASPRF